jgi:hypothetical protein
VLCLAPAIDLNRFSARERQNIQGYGLVQLNEVLRLETDSSVIPYSSFVYDICRNSSDALSTGDIHTYKFKTNSNTKRTVKATLVW